MKLLCIDGNSVLNRAFYGIKLLTTQDGRYTNAIVGFMNIFIKLISDYSPDGVVVAFDMRAKTFRHKLYDKYKANRKGMPDELAEQLPVVKKLLAALGYTIVECEGYEADDILGTFARSCRERGDECLIATGDRDSLQLVSENTSVLLTVTHFGRGELTVMDAAAVYEKYGVTPRQLIDVKALMGDASDNIPGVAGVGEKTATALIAQFGSLDGVYENINDPSIKQGVKTKLEAGHDSAYMSYELAIINTAAPIDADPAHYKKGEGDSRAAAGILTELEMTSILARLGLSRRQELDIKPDLPSVELHPSEFSLFSGNELYVGEESEGLWQLSDGERVYLASPEEIIPALENESVKKYCYDSKRLENICTLKNAVFDIRLAAYLLNPLGRDYSVSTLAGGYRARAAASCPEAPQAPYLKPLCLRLAERLEAEGMSDLLHNIEMPLAQVLSAMEQRGFLVDVKGIESYGAALEGRITELTTAIYTEAGRDFNINSPKQLGTVLEGLGVPLKKRTKSGFSTDAETLEAMRGSHPIIGDILSYRTYQKLKSTYVDGLIKAADREHRIHTEFNQTETRTGRISSLNPNLQNIPVRTELGSKLRKYFIARPGCLLLDADYSQIELRVLAHISGDKRMIADFLSGSDIHTETAATVFGVPRERVTPDMRRHAKAVNFGIVYGIGAYSLSNDIGVSVKEAARYIEEYLSAYSGVRDYLETTVENAKRDGFVTTMYGRRRRLPELANSNKMVQALGRRLAMNTPIQGAAADIIKIAMINVERGFEQAGLSAKLILQVHDELIVEAPRAEAERAAELLKSIMESAAELAVPLTVDVGIGESWYEAKR